MDDRPGEDGHRCSKKTTGANFRDFRGKPLIIIESIHPNMVDSYPCKAPGYILYPRREKTNSMHGNRRKMALAEIIRLF